MKFLKPDVFGATLYLKSLTNLIFNFFLHTFFMYAKGKPLYYAIED